MSVMKTRILDTEGVPPEAQHTAKGLINWMTQGRWARRIPENGIPIRERLEPRPIQNRK